MSVTRLSESCWILPADPTSRTHSIPHYRTRAAAAQLAARSAGTNSDARAGAEPLQLLGCCYQIQCDDCGGIAKNGDDGLSVHYVSIDAARDHLDSWWLPDSGRVRCRWCHARRTDWSTTLIRTQR